MEVAKKDGGLRAGYDEDNEDKEEKAIHVIDLAAPDAVQNKEELNKDTSKRKDTTHNDAWDRLSVNALIRNLSRNLIGPHWLLNWRLSEAKVGTNEGERNRNAKPESKKSDEGEEWNRSRTSLIPKNQVQDEEVGKDDSRAKHTCQQNVALPLLTTEALVDSR